MKKTKLSVGLPEKVREFVLRDFTPNFGELTPTQPANETWRACRGTGSELWLDTGSLDDAGRLWARELTALTTNNTLLNQEVQKGTYDDVIREARHVLADYNLSPHGTALEIAFILNARHALKLVERFDAYVSVEEHTDLAHDEHGALDFARRFHEICPERFIVKIPLTPAGLLAARRAGDEGIPINQTLGFSARHNAVSVRLARPRFVNVFLGRLNSFVAENGLGGGEYVGERAALASQAVVTLLRQTRGAPSRQIAASLRNGGQVRDLAGVDVLTMPPKVAEEFLGLALPPEEITDCKGRLYDPALDERVDPHVARVDTLWRLDDGLIACLSDLEGEDLDAFTPADLVGFFAAHGCGDLLVEWTPEQIATSEKEGKIPKMFNWTELLKSGEVGLDALMNLAGLNSFAADQKAMDDRVHDVLDRG